jgi:NADPH:quinone reductase-like Zn-dependent oxidoreductase
MMKACIIDRYGSKDGVRAGEMPDPQLREDDVLVQIRAAGVNLLDSKIRDGEFKLILPYRLPLILGNDVAGVVVRVGSRVRRFKVGDEVYARPDKDRIGTFAEFIYKKDDFETILHEYDVVLNSQGGETLEKSLRVLKPGGKLISISAPPDPDFAKEIGSTWIVGLLLRLLSYRIRKKAKRQHVRFSFLFMSASGDQLREIGKLIDSGIIHPVVDRIFPFESTKEALAYVEKGRAKGKVVVKVR